MRLTRSPRLSPSTTPRVQRGVSLVFALITIVALSLAAVALIRSVDSGTLILGNLGFKQDTQLAADDGARVAIKWVAENVAATTLHSDVRDRGYYASTYMPLDATGTSLTGNNARTLIDWDGDGTCSGVASGTYATCLKASTALTVDLANPSLPGVTVRYAIFRLCSGAGDPNASGSTLHCAKPLNVSSDEGSDRGSLNYSKNERFGSTGVPQYFRILVRARGQRETVTYTETLVHF